MGEYRNFVLEKNIIITTLILTFFKNNKIYHSVSEKIKLKFKEIYS